MQIGVIGPAGPDDFADDIGDALRRMGHHVAHLGSARARHRAKVLNRVDALVREGLPRLEKQLQRRLVDRAIAKECAVVINVDADLAPEAICRLRHARIRTAFWFPDAVGSLVRQRTLLAPYDALFFKEPHLVDRLKCLLDMPVHYLPEACNPHWHRPIGDAGVERHLVVAGSMYPTRTLLLDRLTASGVPLKLYGRAYPRWNRGPVSASLHTGDYISREGKARVFRSAAGVLNNLNPAEISGMNARLFEAAGCGAAVLTEFRPTLPDLFDIGTELLSFRNFDELLHQSRQLLKDDDLSASFGDAATRRAHTDHTYDKRLTVLLERTL